MSNAEAHELVGAFSEILLDVRDPAELWPDMLLLLQDAVGFDAGYIAASWGSCTEGRGAVVEHDAAFLKLNLGRFLTELSPREVAAYTNRARPHTEIWPRSRQQELGVFNEVLVPTGMRHMLVRASVRHGNVAGLNLERRGLTSPFSDAALQLVDVVSPFLHIVEVLTLQEDSDAGTRAFAESHRLSKREAEFLDLLVRGLQNSEIAMLTRVSVNTVRNTLSRIFEKVSVTTRSELTYLSTHFGEARATGSPAFAPRLRMPDDGTALFKQLVERASAMQAKRALDKAPQARRSGVIYTGPLQPVTETG
jgi:DNA-binding CsgD family transcriptional regulator